MKYPCFSLEYIVLSEKVQHHLIYLFIIGKSLFQWYKLNKYFNIEQLIEKILSIWRL